MRLAKVGSARGHGIKTWAPDKWFSRVVRARADNICETCQRSVATECAHIYSRSNFAIRWSLDNALASCHSCHAHYESHPIDLADLIDAKFPGRLDRLRVKKRGILKNNPTNRALISTFYREQYRKYERGELQEFESWN